LTPKGIIEADRCHRGR